MMDKDALSQLKQLLEEKRDTLEKELSGFAKKDAALKGDWDALYPRVPEGNEEEAADEVEEYSTRLSIEQNLELQLKEITEALERIERGSYGLCEKCDKEIEKERLFALPEARFCSNCLSRA